MSEYFDKGYAVIIGVNDNAIPRAALPTVAEDVKSLKEVLVHPERCAYNPENVRLLLDEESTGKNILDSLDWLREKTTDPEATAVFYYSGHGHLDKATQKYYLIPYDFEGLDRLEESAVKAEAFSAKLAAVQAPRTLIVLDCCHAGGMGAKELEEAAVVEGSSFPIDLLQIKSVDFPEGDGGKALDELKDGVGRAVLNSSTEKQKSWLRKDGLMSLFTYHLIEGLTGHATPPDERTVLVSEVITWVERRVKESAERDGRPSQTPVLKMDGVFPVAMSIGGEGVSKGLGGALPDPLAPLPAVNIAVEHAEGAVIGGAVDTGGGDFAGRDIDKSTSTINQEGVTIGGQQVNISGQKGDIGHIGDVVQGDKVGGDKITVGSISGDSSVVIGRGSSQVVTKIEQGGGSDAKLDALFSPLAALAAAQDPALTGKVNELKAQVSLGSSADDDAVANLIFDITGAAPDTKATIVALFSLPQVSKAAGPATNFVLGRLG